MNSKIIQTLAFISAAKKIYSAASPFCPSLAHPLRWLCTSNASLPCPQYTECPWEPVRRGCTFFYWSGSSHHRAIGIFVPQTSLRPQRTQADASRGLDIASPTLSHTAPQLLSRDHLHLNLAGEWGSPVGKERKHWVNSSCQGQQKRLSTAWEHTTLSSSRLSFRGNCLHNLSPLGSVGEREHSGKDKPPERNHTGLNCPRAPQNLCTFMQRIARFSPSSMHVHGAFGGTPSGDASPLNSTVVT